MNIKSNICQSGGKVNSLGRIINEDGTINFGVRDKDKNYNFVILMDGASGLGKNNEIIKGYTSAEWYVNFMLQNLKDTFIKTPKSSIESVVKECIEKANVIIDDFERQNNILLEEYEKPSASLAILRKDDKNIELYLLGDTETIIGYKNGRIERVENPNQKAVKNNDDFVIRKMQEIALSKKCNVVDTMSETKIKEMLQINRNKKNKECEGGYWICGTDKSAVKYGVHKQFKVSEIDGIILASDGFDYSLLEMNEQEIYKQLKENSAESIVKQIRNIEEKDVGCNKYPRFKKSDDLTIVSIYFSK